MAEPVSRPTISDDHILTLLNKNFTTKEVAKFYVKRAREAAKRAEVDLAGQNTEAFVSNSRIMIENIEMLYRLLGDDNRTL